MNDAKRKRREIEDHHLHLFSQGEKILLVFHCLTFNSGGFSNGS